MEIFGIVIGIVGVAISLAIYVRQSKDQDNWNKIDSGWKEDLDGSVSELKSTVNSARTEVSALSEQVRQLAERNAEAQEERIAADHTPDTSQDSSIVNLDLPANVDDYKRDLIANDADLDPANLIWRKKVRCDGDQRGNLGWFVSDGGDKRYFIHRGRNTTVRPAIPRSLLDAWEKKTHRNPCEIELDYKTGTGSGNHAWFLRAYDGTAWRISRGGHSKTEPTVKEISE